MWCIQEMDSEFVERMYDVLDLYGEPYDPKRPVIGMDEKPKQLLEDSRESIPMKPGSPEKYDYEYKRNGKANIFLAVEPKAGKRVVKVTERRTKEDFAQYIRDLVDLEYCDAEMLRIVLDNLNTHSEKSLYETFDEKEAERVLQKIEFHYSPKHGSWLNIAEIEINVMDTECTGRRMKNREFLTKELAAWEKERNRRKRGIVWKFTKQDADEKLSKYYVT
jgi:hypothetical protein